MSDDLWAVTAYYNPGGYENRRANYHAFRRKLDIPLITVECSDGDFDLSPLDADILVQIPARDVMWQKERLLNIGSRRLPRACTKVVWIDCDIVFAEPDWDEKVSQKLDHFALVQPFEFACLLPPNQGVSSSMLNVLERRKSIVSYLLEVSDPDPVFQNAGYSAVAKYAVGFAWAIRRDILDCCGLFDRFILGAGDKAIFSAAAGRYHDFADTYNMFPEQRRDYVEWAEKFHRSVGNSIGFLERGSIYHLWHGDLKLRRYATRYADFAQFRFDPTNDIAVEEQTHCWRWNSSKPEMQQYVRDYFLSRREDG